MTKKTIVLTLLAMWLSPVTLPAQSNTNIEKNEQKTNQGIHFHENEKWDEMLALAKSENKLIFMDCYTTWCGPCKALSKNVFTQPKVGEYFNQHFINVKYDMEKGDGAMLNTKYKQYIVGYPTLLVIDKNGKVVHQMAGYKEADELIAEVKKGIGGKSLFTMQEEYQQGQRSLDFMKEYIAALKGAFLTKQLNEVTADYLKKMNPQDLDKEDVWQVMGEFITDPDQPAFEYLVKNARRYVTQYNRNWYRIERQLKYACERKLNKILRSYQSDTSLSADTQEIERLLQYAEIASLPLVYDYQAAYGIHKLLLANHLDQAWLTINVCHDLGLKGFTPFAIHDYAAYIAHQTTDKKLLNQLAITIEGYTQTKDYTYRMAKTLTEIYTRLGNKKKSKQWEEAYTKGEEEAKLKYQQMLSK